MLFGLNIYHLKNHSFLRVVVNGCNYLNLHWTFHFPKISTACTILKCSAPRTIVALHVGLKWVKIFHIIFHDTTLRTLAFKVGNNNRISKTFLELLSLSVLYHCQCSTVITYKCNKLQFHVTYLHVKIFIFYES